MGVMNERAPDNNTATWFGDIAYPTESPPTVDAPRPKARRGFAAMSPSLQREIAAMGGRAAHAKGTAHEFDSEQAREAGRKGGVATWERKRAARVADEGAR